MKTQTTCWWRPLLLAGLPAIVAAAPLAAQADSFTEALTGGDVKLDVRARYENVDQDNSLKNADGLTVRTRLGYNTGQFHGFDAFIEMEDNTALIEDYNSGPGGNGKTKYSVIADPDDTEVNQAYLGYSGVVPGTTFKLGRQRIILDNARFIGNVGWRQLEQTFDAFDVVNTSLPDTTLIYAYMDRVRNIFSSSIDMSNHIVNMTYNGFPLARITGYGYFLEYKSSGLSASSNKTIGAYLDGGYEFDSFKVLYRAEYAKQSDYDDGSSDIDADYQHYILGLTTRGVTVKAGYEVLGSDDFGGFETPLATKHALNGWADIFLDTPTDGLRDAYILVTGMLKGVELLAFYHDFQADKGSMDYGTEVDLLASMNFAKHYSVGIKYANYDANDYAVDTDKFWLWGEIKF